MANGTYTNAELVDTLILDLNNLPKQLIDGQFIQFCSVVAQMGQKLINLREGIKADLDGKNRTIEQLKQTLRNCGQTVEDIPAEKLAEMLKEGADDGNS